MEGMLSRVSMLISLNLKVAFPRRSLLAGKGGYIPEDILRSEAEHKAKLKQLEINAKEEWD